jgi:uncharacterized protein with HEPN domain
MTRHDELIRLEHMLEAAREAVALVQSRTREEIERDRIRVLALERLFEIIGEAAAQTTEDIRARYPEIPWNRIVGMRNEIIHGYSTVDLEIVLRTVQNRLPPLIQQLEAVLR